MLSSGIVLLVYALSPNVYCVTMRVLIEEMRAESTVVMFGSCGAVGVDASRDTLNEGRSYLGAQASHIGHRSHPSDVATPIVIASSTRST